MKDVIDEIIKKKGNITESRRAEMAKSLKSGMEYETKVKDNSIWIFGGYLLSLIILSILHYILYEKTNFPVALCSFIIIWFIIDMVLYSKYRIVLKLNVVTIGNIEDYIFVGNKGILITKWIIIGSCLLIAFLGYVYLIFSK